MQNEQVTSVQGDQKSNPIIETKIDMVGEGNWFRVREIKTYLYPKNYISKILESGGGGNDPTISDNLQKTAKLNQSLQTKFSQPKRSY